MLGASIFQLYAFLAFAAFGALCAMVYTFVSGLTKSKLGAVITDAVFGALFIFLLWKLNLKINNGECRLYVFIGIILGAAIAVVTSKHTLDKWSLALYNLTTSKKAVKKDGKTVLQKENIGVGDSGSDGVGVSAVSVDGDVDAVHQPKKHKRRIGKNDRIGGIGRKGKTGTAGIQKNKRLRDRMGGKNGLFRQRRSELAEQEQVEQQ